MQYGSSFLSSVSRACDGLCRASAVIPEQGWMGHSSREILRGIGGHGGNSCDAELALRMIVTTDKLMN